MQNTVRLNTIIYFALKQVTQRTAHGPHAVHEFDGPFDTLPT